MTLSEETVGKLFLTSAALGLIAGILWYSFEGWDHYSCETGHGVTLHGIWEPEGEDFDSQCRTVPVWTPFSFLEP